VKIIGEKEMNWQFVLKARPSPNTVLVEIVIAFDELYNTLSSGKMGSASTGSGVFKKMFRENPDLDTNFETVRKVYGQYSLSHFLEHITEKEFLDRFSKVKELLTQKTKRTDYNEKFFQELFSSKKKPANIKELLVIYQKKIADSVPKQTRSDYIKNNVENTARIQSLYKKNQEKPTVEQFRKNEVPNFDYVLVKVIVEGKEKPKKTGWTTDGNALLKVFEENSDKIESEVAKIDNVSETKVIFSPIRKNFGEKTSLEIETTAKNYNAVEVNQANIANYLNVIEYLPSVSNLSKLDKQIFAVNVEKIKNVGLFGSKLSNVRQLLREVITSEPQALIAKFSQEQFKNRRKFGQYFLQDKGIPEAEQSTKLDTFLRQYTLLKDRELSSKDYEEKPMDEKIIVSQDDFRTYNEFKNGYDRLMRNVQQGTVDEDFNEKIGALPFTDLLKQVVDEGREDETEVVSITQVSNAIKTLLDKTDRSFLNILLIVSFLGYGSRNGSEIFKVIDDYESEMKKKRKELRERTKKWRQGGKQGKKPVAENPPNKEFNSKLEKLFIENLNAFKEKLFEAVNTLLQGIAQKEDEKYFSIANNNKLISKLVESKLLEEAQ
tara:strand:+ start:1806 stop:3620 length:1815 start_codon:yes stop_codon:yes gene_type:complete